MTFQNKPHALVELENAITTLGSIQKERQNSNVVAIKKEVWLIQENDEIKRMTGEILSNSRVSVRIVTTEMGLIIFYKNFRKVLDELVEKDVEIHIKVPIGSSNTSFVRELRNVYQVNNFQVTVPIFLLIVDEKNLLLSSLRKDDQKNSYDKEFGLFTQDEVLSSFILNLLEFDKK